MADKAEPDSFGTFLRGLQRRPDAEDTSDVATRILVTLRAQGEAPTSELASSQGGSIVAFARALDTLVQAKLVETTGEGDVEVVTLTPEGAAYASSLVA